MKKLVAVFIALYFVAMGTMFVWGFIDKQQKEQSLNTNVNNATPSTQQASTVSETPNAATSTSQQNNTAQTDRQKLYNWDEISKHTKSNDCWIVINNNVYDVVNYLDFHPGGADMILMVCGKDATQAYNTKGGRGGGHSSRADKQLASYLIGRVQN